MRTDDNTLYHVNNQYRVQKPGEMGRAQIMVKYDPALGIPNIVKIVINGNTVCPRELLLTDFYSFDTSIGKTHSTYVISENVGGSGNAGRVPSVGLSIDSTTERFDPSFNENEEARPDFPNLGSQNSNTNYGNSNPVNPNRVPTNAPNYANPNYGSSNFANSNNPSYGSSNNPTYSNSNKQPNHGSSSDVHYPSNPPYQQPGTNYGNNNRPQYQETPNYNNANQQANWQSNVAVAGAPLSSNPVSGYNNNGQPNTPYNGTILGTNDPNQIIQLFNNLLSQRNPNASSPTLVVAILPAPSTPEPGVTSYEVPVTTEQTQKYKPSTFSTPTTSTALTTSTTSSVISRTRTNTTTIKSNISNISNGNSNGINNGRS